MGVKATGAWGWQPYHHPVPLSCNLGTLNFWNPLGHSRPVTGLLYFLLISARGGIKHRATVQSEGLCQWQITMTLSGIEPATFRLAARCHRTNYKLQIASSVLPNFHYSFCLFHSTPTRFLAVTVSQYKAQYNSSWRSFVKHVGSHTSNSYLFLRRFLCARVEVDSVESSLSCGRGCYKFRAVQR